MKTVRPLRSGFVRPAALLAVLALAAPAIAGERTYELRYRVAAVPADGVMKVAVELSGDRKDLPSRLAFSIDPDRHEGFEGDGSVETVDGKLVWEPPSTGGKLSYRFRVDRARGHGRYDARMTDSWAIFRADHLVPAVASRAPKGARSRAELVFEMPSGWSVYSGYGPAVRGRIAFDDPDRSLDRPKGWMIVGEIGSRSDEVAGSEVRVAAPKGSGVRRQDTLAMIAWTLPEIVSVFGKPPPHLLVVIGSDPFWRGGLSGPASLFLHADRPLISENRTSTMIHELVHVVSGIHGDAESDWIAEGLAEYYSVEVLRRTGAISRKRFDETIARLGEWGEDAGGVIGPRSSGAVTARAVTVFAAADRAIRRATDDRASLDDVAGALARKSERIGLAELRRVVAEIAGGPVAEFDRERLGTYR